MPQRWRWTTEVPARTWRLSPLILIVWKTLVKRLHEPVRRVLGWSAAPRVLPNHCCTCHPERPGGCARSYRRVDPFAYLAWAEPGSTRPTDAGAPDPLTPTPMRALAEWSSSPHLPEFPAPAMSESTCAPESTYATIGGM